MGQIPEKSYRGSDKMPLLGTLRLTRAEIARRKSMYRQKTSSRCGPPTTAYSSSTFTPNPNMGRPVANKHQVPEKQWKKWSNAARSMFNQMYNSLRPSMQWAFNHPHALPLPKEYWATVRWNVAWEAASIANGEGRLAAAVGAPNIHTGEGNAKKQSRRFEAGTRVASSRKRIPR